MGDRGGRDILLSLWLYLFRGWHLDSRIISVLGYSEIRTSLYA